MLAFDVFASALGADTPGDVWTSRLVIVSGIVATLAGVVVVWLKLKATLLSVSRTEKQWDNNGGSSARDAIDRIELHQLKFEKKWDARFADLEDRTDRIEAAATKAADKAETVAVNLEKKEHDNG